MRRGWMATVLLPLVACGGGGDVGPQVEVPALGSYAYTYHSPRPGGGADLQFTGSFVLTHSSEDSIAGLWIVPGYEVHPAGSGTVNAGRYLLDASTTPSVGGLIIHRIPVGRPGLDVELCGVVFPDPPGYTRIDGTCSFVHE